jgi:hypothetical protein
MEWGFGSLTLSSSGYEDHDHDHIDDHRPFSSASPEPSSSHRKKRQQQQQTYFDHLQDHEYQATAYGDAFRLAVLNPGAGTQAIEIELIWESIKAPQRRDYKCLSYCWQTTVQDAAILVDGRRFEVTSNLLRRVERPGRARAHLAADEHHLQRRRSESALYLTVLGARLDVRLAPRALLGQHRGKSRQCALSRYMGGEHQM